MSASATPRTAAGRALRTVTELTVARLHEDRDALLFLAKMVEATDRDPDLRRRARNLLRDIDARWQK